jgi:hypothetical protein
MEGRGTMSSMLELDAQPAAARQASNAAKTPDERIPEPVLKQSGPTVVAAGTTDAIYEREITKKG